MKKYIKILSVATLLFLVNSCSNEAVNEDTTEKNLVAQIEEITNTFLISQDNETPLGSRVFDPTLYIVDIEAGLDDYMENGDESQAIEVGTLASTKASSQHIQPLNGNGGNAIDDVVNFDNPKDYTGKFHAEILNVGLTNYRDLLFPNGVFNYNNASNFARHYLTANNIYSNTSSVMTESEFNTFYTSISNRLQSNNYQLSKVVVTYANEGKLSSAESQILEMYFQAQENSTSLNGYIQYSLQVENSVLNSNLPASSKDLLLFTMATARHDINFWNPY